MTLANFHRGQGGSTNSDRWEGIKGLLMTNFRGNVSLSWCWEDLFHIYYSRVSVCRYFRFQSSRTANPLPIFPLKNLCQSLMRYSLYLPLSPLMWQNKPWAIRIKALKRSLKPLKVSLNQEVTIWAVWQQALNGVIASPPQWALLSFPNPTHPVQSYQTPSTAVVYSIVCEKCIFIPCST